jgi:hypothetical protein
MSQENVEIARRLYLTLGSVDLVPTLADRGTLGAVREAFEPFVHRDFETLADSRYQMMLGVETGEEGRSAAYGIDGLIDFWREWLSAWESWIPTPTEFIDVDADRVLVLLDVRAHSKTHGVEVPLDGANLLTLRDGKLARLELFMRRTDALEAAGLSE